MSNLVPLLVAVPIGAGFLIPLAAGPHSRVAAWLGNATLATLLAISIAIFGSEGIYSVGGWPTPTGIDLRVDDLTTLMLIVINTLALLVGLYSVAYLRRSTAQHHYYALLMFLVAGTNGVAVTGDLFNLYVFMEITAIASYALVAVDGADESFEASLKYLVLGGLASSVILVGIVVLYAMTGVLNMSQLAGRLTQVDTVLSVHFALAMMFGGLALKAGLVPFHAWLPDAYPAAPAPISAMLSGVVSKVIGVYVLARLLFNVFGIRDDTMMLMRSMGGITMVVGGLLALAQSDIKRLLAYSSISQVGLVVLALGFATHLGVVGGIYHLVNHAAFKPLLFFGSGQLERACGTRDLRQMHGLGRRMPITAATCMTGSLTLAGIPPLSGFWSKLIIVIAAVESGHMLWAITVVVFSIVSLAYQLKMQQGILYDLAEDGGRPVSDKPIQQPLLTAIPMIVLAIGCVALSCLVITGLDRPLLIGPAVDALMRGRWVP